MSSPNENNPPNLQTPTSFHTKQQVSSPFILPTTPIPDQQTPTQRQQQQEQQEDDGGAAQEQRETKVKYIWGTNIRVQKAATVIDGSLHQN
jgi:glucan phosphoethanolaminetransferase (alkaline phosphatase superfamily)